MDLTIRSQTIANEDRSWLGSEFGTDTCDPITLDGTQLATYFATGIVPSGAILAKASGTGLYGRYVNGDSTYGTPAGHLATTVTIFNVYRGDAAGVYHNVGGALQWQGEVIEANLPTGSGVDSAAKTALTHFRYV